MIKSDIPNSEMESRHETKRAYDASRKAINESEGKLPIRASWIERELNATRAQIRMCIAQLIAEDARISKRLEELHDQRKQSRGGA